MVENKALIKFIYDFKPTHKRFKTRIGDDEIEVYSCSWLQMGDFNFVHGYKDKCPICGTHLTEKEFIK